MVFNLLKSLLNSDGPDNNTPNINIANNHLSTPQTTERKHTTTYGVGNPGPSLEEVHKCWGFQIYLVTLLFWKQRYNRYVIKFQDFFLGFKSWKTLSFIVSGRKLAMVNIWNQEKNICYMEQLDLRKNGIPSLVIFLADSLIYYFSEKYLSSHIFF